MASSHSQGAYQRQPAKKPAAPAVSGHTPTGPYQKQPVGAPLSGVAPPPSAQPLPPDPNAELAKLTGNRNLAIARGDTAYDTGNLNFDYGYNPDGTVNTSNPYSRAALFQLQHENAQRGTTNSFAAQGQLYAGSLANQQGINDSQYAQNEAANRLAYQRGLHGIQRNLLGAMAGNSMSAGDNDFNTLIKNVYPGS